MWLDVALTGIWFCLGQRKVSAQEMCEAHGAEGRYVCVSSDVVKSAASASEGIGRARDRLGRVASMLVA